MCPRRRPSGRSIHCTAIHAISPASAAKAAAPSMALWRMAIIGANASSTGKRAPMIQLVARSRLNE